MRERLTTLRRERGAAGAIGAGVRWIAERTWLNLESRILQITRGGRFSALGREFDYFYHPYNATYRSERAVEIPIARAEILAHPGARILEVGNVLSHYFPVDHVVVDKYERAEGVRNEDVLEHRPENPYDLIICLSTIEHVGRDEPEGDPEKALRAVAHLREKCLAPGGRILLTVPVGYNPAIDRALGDGAIVLRPHALLRRSGKDNRWTETEWGARAEATYDFTRPGADWVVVGFLGGK